MRTCKWFAGGFRRQDRLCKDRLEGLESRARPLELCRKTAKSQPKDYEQRDEAAMMTIETCSDNVCRCPNSESCCDDGPKDLLRSSLGEDMVLLEHILLSLLHAVGSGPLHNSEVQHVVW